MFAKLKNFLSGEDSSPLKTAAVDETKVATAALLIEAALTDETYCDAEKKMVSDLLQRHYDMSEEEVTAVVAQAEAAQEKSEQILSFTRTVKESVAFEDRVHIIEMLWELAYADGEISAYEANLIRRICGLIYVDDVESGRVRKLVEARNT